MEMAVLIPFGWEDRLLLYLMIKQRYAKNQNTSCQMFIMTNNDMKILQGNLL